jgi:hypothetical protein
VHRSLKHLLAAAFFCLPGNLVAQATAPPGTGAGQAGQPATRFNFPTPLFQQPNVGQTLNLNRDQMTRLNGMTQQLQNRFQGDFNRAFTGSGRDRDAAMQALQGRFNSDFMKGAGGIFNDQQMTRYRQLQLQSQGASALLSPDVASRLNLTDEQRTRLRNLDTQYQRQLRDFTGSDASRRADFRNRWETFQRENGQRINGILDENQRRMWSQMTGERFNFAPPTASGPGGAGGTTPRR